MKKSIALVFALLFLGAACSISNQDSEIKPSTKPQESFGGFFEELTLLPKDALFSEEFKKALPHITIATDIIVGFPTETEQEFLDSVDLIKKTMPDIVNVSRYRLRHGTLASKMEGQVLDEESKKRSKLLSHICENISTLRNESWRDWQGEVMIDENGKNNTWIARNFAYKQIILEGNFSMGEKVNVKIIKTNPYDLRGIIC